MNDVPPQPNLDERAIMRLAQVRESLAGALATFGADPVLKRAFTHGIGAIDDRLGRPRDMPSRRMRRTLK